MVHSCRTATMAHFSATLYTPAPDSQVNPTADTYLQLSGSIAGTSSFGAVWYEWTKTDGDDADNGYTSVRE